MDLIKSPNDKKEYRVITLKNGLTAMLISDVGPELVLDEQKQDLAEGRHRSRESSSGCDSDEPVLTDSSMDTSEEDLEAYCEKDTGQETRGKNKLAAAALCVGVGSFSDPEDVPGLAHFLEHMIFMGNEKYPEENYFDAIVSKYGGSNNAYTDHETTIFHLDVRPQYLHEVLDVFAACFASPTLKADSMDREIEAVDSEFHLSSPKDSERMELILASCAKNGHPMTKFMRGNSKTLKDDPRVKNIDICEELRKFWKSYYSANHMTLAVISVEPLDTLENWVVETFSSIPNNGMPRPSFEKFEEPFKTDKFHKLYQVVPVKGKDRIVISWALPPLKKWYRVKPLNYLDWVVGHEGRGSIIAFLRKRHLACDLEAGNGGDGFEFNSMCALFRISIVLTDEGINDILEVLSVVFQYLKMLRNEGPQERIFQEVKDIEDNSFRFQEEVDESLYVEEIVENMQLYPKEHYLVGDKLFFDFDKEIIKACGDALTFEDANIMILSSCFDAKNICKEREPWTQAPYCSVDFPEDWVKRLTDLDVHPELHLPEVNEYIAKDFTLKPDPALPVSEYPVKILDNQYGCLWYKKDTKFKVPKGYICFLLVSPVIKSTPGGAAALDLLLNCLNQMFAEDLYSAEAARLSFSVYIDDYGLVLRVNGLNDKLHRLFEEILARMVNFSVSDSLFVSMKNQVLRSYQNRLFSPSKLCSEVKTSILSLTHWSLIDRMAALQHILKEDLINFSQIFLSNIYFEGLIQGNFTVEEALALGAIVKEKTNAAPLSPDNFPKLQCVKIPQGEAFCCVSSLNPADRNSVVVNYYQSGPGKIRTSCLLELLLSIMDEPCFDMLRTKETLGYDVSCAISINFGVLGFVVTVKSPSKKFSCSYIDQRIEAFLQSFAAKIQELSEEEFNIMKASLIDLKGYDDLNLKEEVGRHWAEIVGKNYLFDRLKKEIECLQSITLDELKSSAQEHLSPNRIRKLGVQVVGGDGIMPHLSFKNVHEPAHRENSSSIKEVCKLHFLRPSESDETFISDISEYKWGLEAYEYCKIIS